jgi:hypothetical protein
VDGEARGGSEAARLSIVRCTINCSLGCYCLRRVPGLRGLALASSRRRIIVVRRSRRTATLRRTSRRSQHIEAIIRQGAGGRSARAGQHTMTEDQFIAS